MAPKALLFSLASLLIGSSHALSNSVNGNANGNCTFDATMAGSCAAKLDGKLPSFVPSNFHFGGNVRRYYIAAEEVEWDYAPTGWDNWLGVPMDVSPRANSAGANQFGTKWLKALYRGYTDQSFSQYSEQPPYQGTQGPTIRGEVGDMIEIMFVNKMRKNYATMHSMGLDYTKHSEGADYPNTTTPDASNTLSETNAVPPIQAGIAPQGCVVYKWLVSDSAGPNPSQPARTHSYHSYVSLEQDSNAGLIGPTIVYRRGEMAKTMAAYREIPLLYMIYNEANSFLSASNAAALLRHNTRTPTSTQSSTAHFPSGNSSIWLPQIANLNSALNFPSAPSFYTMNGYIFANNPIYDMCLDDKVIWYVNAYGAASHVFHMHGNGVTYQGNSEYAVSINDGVGKTLVMDAVGEGVWQIICHVDNHHAMGMVSNYRVREGGECKVPHL